MTASLDPTGLVPYLFYGGRFKNIEQWHVLYWKAWVIQWNGEGNWTRSNFYDQPVIVNEPVTRELIDSFTPSKVFDFRHAGSIFDAYELPGFVYVKPPEEWINV